MIHVDLVAPSALGLWALCAAALPASALRVEEMPLRDYVNRVSIFMPQEGSNAYVVPTAEERAALGAAAKALLAGDVAKTEAALMSVPGFELLDFRDGAGGPEYWAIVEKTPLTRGWGFFFWAKDPLRGELVVEAPHPLADRGSEQLAARAVTQLRPAAFVLAGAHRYADAGRSSDMTHAANSIFEVMHEAFVDTRRTVLQIHGFSAAAHPGYPELLLSSGTTAPGPDAEALCIDVTSGGVACTLFDGSAFTDLGAQSNVQGAHTRTAAGMGHFLHFETSDAIRDDPSKTEALIGAIERRWPAKRTTGGCQCVAAADALWWSAVLWPLAARRSRRRFS